MSGIVPFSPKKYSTDEYSTVQSPSWQSVVQFHVHIVPSSTPMENESTAQGHGWRPSRGKPEQRRKERRGMEYPSDLACLADGRACAGGDAGVTAGQHALVRQASLDCTCYPHQAYEARRFAHLQIARLQPLAAALPNGRPKCAGSTVMLPAEMEAPVAASGHAAEIDILLVGFLPF